MKAILLTAILFLGACASTPTKPAKELTLREKVIGTYERKKGRTTLRVVFLDNGASELYGNGELMAEGGKWMIVDGELHGLGPDGNVGIWRINEDKSITSIGGILDGKRINVPKDKQFTYKKIK